MDLIFPQRMKNWGQTYFYHTAGKTYWKFFQICVSRLVLFDAAFATVWTELKIFPQKKFNI